jgi:hypothetical protein
MSFFSRQIMSSEKVQNLDQISEKLAEQGRKFIFEICDVAYTRLPGSDNEEKAQTFLEKKMKEFGADDVHREFFSVYSKFFLWWARIPLISFIISFVFYFPLPLFSAIIGAIGVLNVVLKVFSFQVFDIFFKKNKSSNVIAKLKTPSFKGNMNSKGTSTKSKAILILGGHSDSNYEYPILKSRGVSAVKVFVIIGSYAAVFILGNLIRFIIHMRNGEFLLVNQPVDWFFIILVIFSPLIWWFGLRMIVNHPVPGANDNLSGIVVATEVLKYFTSHPDQRPKNVEIWFVCFGSEEGGMMGSKDLSKKVKNQLDNGTFPAEKVWVVNFDSIGANGPLYIATKEPMYRATYLPDVPEQLVNSAKIAGVDFISKSLTAGTDSAPFGRLGIPAAGIVCFGDGNNPPNWHSLSDTPENVDVRGIRNSIKLALQFIHDIDIKFS